jgi:hypothetical protein
VQSALPDTLVLCLLGRLISKRLLNKGYVTWLRQACWQSWLAFEDFVGWTAFVADRGDGEREKTRQDAGVRPSAALQNSPKEIEVPETEARLRRWAKAAVAGAMLLTVLLSIVSWHGAEQAMETADWVAHTHEAMTALESTLRHSLDVETAGRGLPKPEACHSWNLMGQEDRWLFRSCMR